MDYFEIEGGQELKGVLHPQGNKNEALPILGALLLTREPVVLHNIPEILDTYHMIELLKSVGVEVKPLHKGSFKFHALNIACENINFKLAQSIRGSLTLIPPLLERCSEIIFPKPGGDKIGRRRLDTHFMVLKTMGVTIQQSGNHYLLKKPKHWIPGDILLDEASVTATENVIMLGTLASGLTIARNVASEPHVTRLCNFLNKMGAKIQGMDSNTIVIQGGNPLKGITHQIGPDYLETGSFIALAATTNSELRIQNAGIPDLRQIRNVFSNLGVNIIEDGSDIIIPKNQTLQVKNEIGGDIRRIDDAPWPGFPADMMSVTLVLATQCKGTTLFFEKMFESRLFFIDKLIEMGAQIVLCDPHRAVVIGGNTPLHGHTMSSPDIRAGIALLIATLKASGKSRIYNVEQIDRGYEKIDERLNAVGAKIRRITN